jgi:hypothetical protein
VKIRTWRVVALSSVSAMGQGGAAQAGRPRDRLC